MNFGAEAGSDTAVEVAKSLNRNGALATDESRDHAESPVVRTISPDRKENPRYLYCYHNKNIQIYWLKKPCKINSNPIVALFLTVYCFLTRNGYTLQIYKKI